MEEKLTLEELNLLAKTIFDKDKNNRRFLAAIQGIDIGNDDEQEQDVIEFAPEGYDLGLGYEEQ